MKAIDAIEAETLAIHRLSVREYGSGEMRAYLKRKGASDADADAVVRDLIERKVIDDERYARVIARHQAHRDKGPAYVMMRLKQKGVHLSRSKVAEIFAEVLPDSTASELELARQVIERRYPGVAGGSGDRKERAKAYAALARRGFSRDVIAQALGAAE
jgi:regulatory protein